MDSLSDSVSSPFGVGSGGLDPAAGLPANPSGSPGGSTGSGGSAGLFARTLGDVMARREADSQDEARSDAAGRAAGDVAGRAAAGEAAEADSAAGEANGMDAAPGVAGMSNGADRSDGGAGRQEVAAAFALQWAMLAGARPDAGASGSEDGSLAAGTAAGLSGGATGVPSVGTGATSGIEGLGGLGAVGAMAGWFVPGGPAGAPGGAAVAGLAVPAGQAGALAAASTVDGVDRIPPVVAVPLGLQLSVLTTAPATQTPDADLLDYARRMGVDPTVLRMVFGPAGGVAGDIVAGAAEAPVGASMENPLEGAAPGSAEGTAGAAAAQEAMAGIAAAASPGLGTPADNGLGTLAGTSAQASLTLRTMSQSPGSMGTVAPGLAGAAAVLRGMGGTASAPGGGVSALPAGADGAWVADSGAAGVPGVAGLSGLAARAREAGGAGAAWASAGTAKMSAAIASSGTVGDFGVGQFGTGRGAAVVSSPGSAAGAAGTSPVWAGATVLAISGGANGSNGANGASGANPPPGFSAAQALAAGLGGRGDAPSWPAWPSSGMTEGLIDEPAAVGAAEALLAGRSGAAVESGMGSALGLTQGGAPNAGALGIAANGWKPALAAAAEREQALEAAQALDLRLAEGASREALAERVGQALAQRLLEQVDKGQWQLRLNVHPQELGPIDISLRANGQRLEAQFQVAHAHTQSLIQDSLARLREAVGASGMDLASVWVSGGWNQRNRGNPTPGQPDDPASAQRETEMAGDEGARIAGVEAVDRSRTTWRPGQGSLDILI